jgi:hypothetical protein
MPELMRGASLVSPTSVSSGITRPRAEAAILGLPPMPAAVFSSLIEFHSPQASHRPDHFPVTLPQFWQTKVSDLRAI